MPIKHQAKSYRNKNGVQYECWTDCNHEDAAAIVADLRAKGHKAYAVHNRKEGYSRVFLEAGKAKEIDTRLDTCKHCYAPKSLHRATRHKFEPMQTTCKHGTDLNAECAQCGPKHGYFLSL